VVQETLGDARGVYEKLVGIVLNRVNVDTLGRYDGYGSSFYHNEHYKRYGYTD